MTSRLFFSYSHKDEGLRDELEVHLAMLLREGILSVWHDRRILAGDDLDDSISDQLEQSDIILFLVSPDFLASDYCYGVEMERAMERHTEGSARVIPVILRPFEWNRAPFGRLAAAPKDGRPVTKWPDRDEAFLDVTRAIRRAVEGVGKPAERVPPREVVVRGEPNIARPGPRSANLRVAKDFNERAKDKFIEETFEFVANFFENSLQELSTRNEGIEAAFKRVDANRFTSAIYSAGRKISACTIFRGADHPDIGFSLSDRAETNSYNESVSIEHDDQSLFFKALGMSRIADSGSRDAKLSMEGVAELFWSIFIEPAQRNRH